jgi:hypothetical protein
MSASVRQADVHVTQSGHEVLLLAPRARRIADPLKQRRDCLCGSNRRELNQLRRSSHYGWSLTQKT